MDSEIALAIMAKAKRVFESEDTFLSFPVTPCTYTRQQLSFVTGDYQSPGGMLRLCEFSRLVNQVPTGTIWQPGEERYIWDIYDDVLGNAKLASSTRTTEEEAEYQRAHRFLYEKTEDGLVQETLVMMAYRACKDSWHVAREEYAAAESTAVSSTDPAVRQRWRTVEEPDLREKLNAAQSRWVNEGQKREVEQAKRIVAALGSKSAFQTWAEWSALFNKDLDLLTDPTSNQRFAPSAFSPVNALEASSWHRFVLSGDEADALVDQAPRELRSRLASDHVDLDVESLSFEFSSAKVIRAWLRTDVFRARFWRFDDSSKVLSDGGTPPKGLCPAYVAAVVFARNPEIKPKMDSRRNDPAFNRLASGQSLSLGFFQVAVASAGAARRKATSRRPSVLTLVPAARPVSQPQSGAMPTRSSTMRVVARRATVNPQIVSRMRKLAFVRTAPSLQAAARTAVSAPTIPAEPTPHARNDDEVIVLALICKRLPRCPNPDPDLAW